MGYVILDDRFVGWFVTATLVSPILMGLLLNYLLFDLCTSMFLAKILLRRAVLIYMKKQFIIYSSLYLSADA